METLFLSAKQAFEGGRVQTGHGSARIVAGSRDGQIVHTDSGVRLVLRVEQARIHEETMTGLQAEYGGAVRVNGELLRYPSGSVHGSRSFHETPSGPIILVIRVPDENGDDKKKDAKDEGAGVGGGLSRGPSEVRVRTEWRLWSGVLLLGIVGLFVAVPVVRKSTEEARKTKHLGIVRAAAASLIAYAADNDDRLPLSDPLKTAGATTATEAPLVVPDDLLGEPLGTDRLSEKVLVQDARPWPDGRIAVAYADGHVKWERPNREAAPARP